MLESECLRSKAEADVRPYVYNVFAGDVDGLHHAVKTAISRPIESFVLPEMTPEAVKETVKQFLAFDWKGTAEAYVREHPP